MSVSPYIEELRLTSFKSFRDAVLPLDELTLLIGRNGSGKSNAIDALHVLARLAEGDDIREAIDGGRRDNQEVRGGVAGCAPYGEAGFELGCTVVAGADHLRLDVRVQTEPETQIVSERLTSVDARGAQHDLLVTDPPTSALSDISARWRNGKRGINPAVAFRADRLLVAQVPLRIPSTLKAGREVHTAAAAVIAALREVFVLDPVPSLMRQYVNERDVSLRRQGENLSAVIGALRGDPVRWQQLKELAQGLSAHEVCDIEVERSPLGDVMAVLLERFDDRVLPFSARVMSDGMLRFLAFAAALLEPPLIDETTDGAVDTLLVIEEIENGLHPSQAARVVRLIKEESMRRRIRTFVTTHSPAILTALDGDDHRGVVLCRRDAVTGISGLQRLVDLPGYPGAMAAGSLGDAVIGERLEDVPDATARLRSLDDLLAQL